jgi:hypothetical protein
VLARPLPKSQGVQKPLLQSVKPDAAQDPLGWLNLDLLPGQLYHNLLRLFHSISAPFVGAIPASPPLVSDQAQPNHFNHPLKG